MCSFLPDGKGIQKMTILKQSTRIKELLAFVPDLHLGVTNTETSPTSPELDLEINFVQLPVLASSAKMLGWNTATARNTPSITPNIVTFIFFLGYTLQTRVTILLYDVSGKEKNVAEVILSNPLTHGKQQAHHFSVVIKLLIWDSQIKTIWVADNKEHLSDKTLIFW